LNKKKKKFIRKISDNNIHFCNFPMITLFSNASEKYDLEKRLQTQEYDVRKDLLSSLPPLIHPSFPVLQLKELNERQRQINRQKLHNKGMDPTSANSRFPV
jgi:hypothetical protein